VKVNKIELASALEDARYARQVAMTIKPEKLEEYVSLMKNQVFPRTKKCEGARRLYLLRSTKANNDFLVLTLWDSKEEADGYANSEAYSKNSDELLPMMVTPEPALSEYFIETHDVNAEDLLPPETAREEIKKELASTPQKRKVTKKKKAKPAKTTKRSVKRKGR
jgi:quinol monooxygenase YgiN